MSVTVKVNGTANSLVHKGSNGISTATIPDVCKTPSPGGPVPIPYPNISQSATLDKGTTTVKADGGMMIAIKGSEFSLSNGDNAGVAGGVKSSTFMKESTWILYSFDVKMDGSNACRLTDKKFQNHENTADMAGEIQAIVAWRMAQLQEIACECNEEIKDKNADGTDNERSCQFLGVLKHKCCEAKIRDHTRQGSKSGVKGETGYSATGTPPTELKGPRGTAAPADSSWPDAIITDGKGNPLKVVDFKFQCQRGDSDGWREQGWTKYSGAKGSKFLSQEHKYKDLSKRLGIDPNQQSQAPELITNEDC
ncbi:PAAR-like domain-containing protein [Roseateles sp.]|uniref:PAAR-like domain-containing protein n=1 Tax=Roseateles sp. TaxID=1971397 RepID=UPI0039EBFD3D